jgi:predicted anti-sigma-YlaC factor YlaD
MTPEQHQELQAMLSAYLDRELTQASEQRVRLHLEDCAACRQAYEEMLRVQQLTKSIRFPNPPEARMEELEKSLSVRAPRRAGWTLILGGFAAWLIYAIVMAVMNWRAPTGGELIAGAIVVGALLLLISVLMERLRQLPHDRYRGVKR